MSYKLVHDALHTDGCKGLTKFVLVALADFANDETGECYPAQGTIAKIVGCSRQSVYEQIDNLESLGYVRRLGKYRLGLKYKVTIQPSQSDCDNLAVTIDKSPNCDNLAVMTAQPSQLTSPSNMTAQPSGVTTQPSGYDGSAVTNREENREIKRENNLQASKAKVIDSIKSKEPNAALPPPSDFLFSLREIAMDASRRLIAKGLSADDALAKLRSIKINFMDKAKALKASGDLADKNNPMAYLAAMMASMALEGPKPMAASSNGGGNEPKTVDGIIAALKAEYRQVYADAAGHIDSIFEDISPRTMDSINAAAARGWAGISSPLSWVRTRIDGQVYSQVEAARADELESASRALVRLRNRLAEVQWAGQNGDKSAAAKITDLKAKVEQLETRLRKNAAA